jgi:hypothetical protein
VFKKCYFCFLFINNPKNIIVIILIISSIAVKDVVMKLKTKIEA